MKIINKLKNIFLKELMIIALLIIITISSTGQVFAKDMIITNSIEIADEIDQGGLGGAISESESTGIPQNEEDDFIPLLSERQRLVHGTGQAGA